MDAEQLAQAMEAKKRQVEDWLALMTDRALANRVNGNGLDDDLLARTVHVRAQIRSQPISIKNVRSSNHACPRVVLPSSRPSRWRQRNTAS